MLLLKKMDKFLSVWNKVKSLLQESSTSLLSHVSFDTKSLLFWDKPYISACTLVTINCLYWLLVFFQWRVYGVLSSLALLFFLHHTWITDIRPLFLTAGPDHTNENLQESGVGLKPSDLATYYEVVVANIKQGLKDAAAYRQDQPLLFCVAVSSLFAFLGMIGRMVSGVILLYILLMAVTLGPGIVLHVIPPTWTHFLFSFFSSTGEDDLKDFIPEGTEEALARQFSMTNHPDIEDDEDEEEDICHLPSMDIPLTPVGESLEEEAIAAAEMDLKLEGSESEDEAEFTKGLSFQSQKSSPSSPSTNDFELISKKDLLS